VILSPYVATTLVVQVMEVLNFGEVVEGLRVEHVPKLDGLVPSIEREMVIELDDKALRRVEAHSQTPRGLYILKDVENPWGIRSIDRGNPYLCDEPIVNRDLGAFNRMFGALSCFSNESG
jgi:hypothetical protein